MILKFGTAFSQISYPTGIFNKDSDQVVVGSFDSTNKSGAELALANAYLKNTTLNRPFSGETNVHDPRSF